jgi:hypothetical protein
MPTAHLTRHLPHTPKRFSGQYANRTITGDVGHNLPQEAPQAFAQAVVDVGRMD